MSSLAAMLEANPGRYGRGRRASGLVVGTDTGGRALRRAPAAAPPRTYEIHIYGRPRAARATMGAAAAGMPDALVAQFQRVLRDSLLGAGAADANLQNAAHRVIAHLAGGGAAAHAGARNTMHAAIAGGPIAGAGGDYYINLNLAPMPFVGTQINNWVQQPGALGGLLGPAFNIPGLGAAGIITGFHLHIHPRGGHDTNRLENQVTLTMRWQAPAVGGGAAAAAHGGSRFGRRRTRKRKTRRRRRKRKTRRRRRKRKTRRRRRKRKTRRRHRTKRHRTRRR